MQLIDRITQARDEAMAKTDQLFRQMQQFDLVANEDNLDALQELDRERIFANQLSNDMNGLLYGNKLGGVTSAMREFPEALPFDKCADNPSPEPVPMYLRLALTVKVIAAKLAADEEEAFARIRRLQQGNHAEAVRALHQRRAQENSLRELRAMLDSI